jgi:hypothetical protein
MCSCKLEEACNLDWSREERQQRRGLRGNGQAQHAQFTETPQQKIEKP